MSGPLVHESRPGTTTRPDVQRAIDRAAAARPIPGNRITLLQDGPQAYPVMLEVIASATRRLHFENYIIRNDATGRRFAEALMARSRAGVHVRVLYDWLGSISTGRSFWRRLRQAGCEVRCFNPPSLLRPLRAVARDHRKLVVADGARSVVGGLCIGDEWAGDPDRAAPPWRDTAVLIEGPASQALDLAFGNVWGLTGPPLSTEELAAEVAMVGEAEVRVVVGVPGRERAYRVLEYLAAGCRRRLWIVDAYLVPPPRLFDVLALAAGDAVDIRLLVPGTSDLPVVRDLGRIGYRDLLRAGIRIFEWQGPMIHAKTMVADGRWSRVGTSNINASSLIGNYELDVVIEDEPLAQAMEHQFRLDVAHSVEVVRQRRPAPAALSRVMPSQLQPREQPEIAVERARGARELRARAVVAVRRLASGAFRSLLGPVSLVLVVVGLLAVRLPTFVGYLTGALCLWFAATTGLQVWRRRSTG
jgi:cardiolipin synthase